MSRPHVPGVTPGRGNKSTFGAGRILGDFAAFQQAQFAVVVADELLIAGILGLGPRIAE